MKTEAPRLARGQLRRQVTTQMVSETFILDKSFRGVHVFSAIALAFFGVIALASARVSRAPVGLRPNLI